MAKKQSVELSQPEKLVRRSEADIRRYMASAKFQKDAGRSRAYGPDPSEADLEEIPELTDEELAAMRPVKQSLTVRLDTDVLEWLKASGPGYHTRINAILRAVMLRRQAKARK